MPYCPNCGAEASAGTKFCNNCGANMAGSGDPPPPPPPGAYSSGYGEPSSGYSATRTVPDYLVQSILVTLFCCLPFGIAAIVFAAQANSKKGAGDYDGAIEAANKAKTFCWISVGVGLAVGVLYGLAIVAGSNSSV